MSDISKSAVYIGLNNICRKPYLGKVKIVFFFFFSLERMPMSLIQKSPPVFPKSTLLQKGKIVMWRDLLIAEK